MNQNLPKFLFVFSTILALGWMGCTKEEENKIQSTTTALALRLVEFDTVQLQATFSGVFDAIEINDNEAAIKRNFYAKNSGFWVSCLRIKSDFSKY